MADWNIWLRDGRKNPLARAHAKLAVSEALARFDITVVEGPWVLVPPERHVGEWVFVVRDQFAPNRPWAELKINEALSDTFFEMLDTPELRPRRHS